MLKANLKKNYTNDKKKAQTGKRSTKLKVKAVAEEAVTVATALGSIVTEPKIQMSVTSQSSSCFIVPVRMFKAKSTVAWSSKNAENGGGSSKVLLGFCLNGPKEWEMFNPNELFYSI